MTRNRTRIALLGLDENGGITTDPTITHAIAAVDQASGATIAQYARTLHPLYKREGFTIDPPAVKGRKHARSFYEPGRLAARQLDRTLQHKLYVHPQLSLTGDEKSHQPNWSTIYDIVDDLAPLLAD